jgi:hypothetical protein
VPVNKVAILVVDTFNKQPIAPTESTKSKNCLFDIDSLDWSWKGSADTPGLRPHGEYVFSEVQHQLEALDWSSNGPTRLAGNNGNYDMESWEKDGQQIRIVKVDTKGFTTANIRMNIEDAIDSLTQLNDGTDRFVLNMSFGAVPCPANTDLSSQELLDKYRKTLEMDPEFAFLKTYLEGILDGLNPDDPGTKNFLLFDDSVAILRVAAAYTPFLNLDPKRDPAGEGFDSKLGIQWQGGEMFGSSSEDPLHAFIREHPTVFAVGASGNSDFNFPFAPAMWDHVLAVSAPEERSPPTGSESKAFKANAGEVQLSGVYSLDSSIIGTSFAAPKLSILAAIYLLNNNNPTCKTSAGDLLNPALNYVPQLSGSWQRLNIDIARQTYCPEFPRLP